MVHGEEDTEWMPPYKRHQKSSLVDWEGTREPAYLRRTKRLILEKIQDIKKPDDFLTDAEDAEVFTNISEKIQPHHKCPSDDFFNFGPEGNNGVATNNNMIPKRTLTLLKQDLIRRRKFLTEIRHKLHLMALSNTVTQHPTNHEEIFLTKPLKLLQRMKKSENPRKQPRKRKKIKPQLSVTIPENKLFPKSKSFKAHYRFTKVKKAMLNKNESKNKKCLQEITTESFKKGRKLFEKEIVQMENDKEFKTNCNEKSHLQCKSLSSSELPIGLCNKGSMNAEFVTNSPDRKSADISYTLDTHFTAVQRILKNLAVKNNCKLKGTKKRCHGSKKGDKDMTFPQLNSTPWFHTQLDNKDGKLIVKITRMPSKPQINGEISEENGNIKMKQSDGTAKEPVATRKNITLHSSKKMGDSTNLKISNPIFDDIKREGIQFIDNCYSIILKDITSKMSELFESRFGITEISRNKDSIKANKGNKIYCYEQGDMYKELYEDFIKNYAIAFDNDTNVICSKMGELLQHIVTEEELVLCQTSHIISDTGNIYNKNSQEKIKNLNTFFLEIYNKICGVSDNIKQRKILVIACIVKIKRKISSIASRPWTLKETRLNLITFLTKDNVILPSAGEVFFMQEEAFLQDCMMVVDYTLKSSNDAQQLKKDFNKPQDSEEKLASPNKPCKGSADNQSSSESINTVQHLDSKSSHPSMLNNISGDREKKVSSLVHTLCETQKKSSAGKLEKIVEHIRIGDIDLDYASCEIMQVLKTRDTFIKHDCLLKKVDSLIKNF